MEQNILILDCTLRDGGYYNNWSFDDELVKSYLSSIAKSGVDYVELGLRNFPQDRFLGAFAYTTDAYLELLELPSELNYGVMVDAKALLKRAEPMSQSVRALFKESSDSKVSLVRIAAHFSEVDASREIAEELKKLGYLVGFNLMQSGGKPSAAISEKAAEIASWEVVDVLYFADSLGNMDAGEVRRIIQAIKSQWQGEIGIHTHNNQGKAIGNSLTASNEGVKWLDSTMLGMGRGAGNSPTEILLLELENLGVDRFNCASLYPAILDYFEPLQSKHKWGPSLLYHLAALNEIHPTYIQSMLSDKRYSNGEIVESLNFMKAHDCSSYRQDMLTLASQHRPGSTTGSWNATGWCGGQDVVIIGPGPSASKHAEGIKQYLSSNRQIVLSLNLNHRIDPLLIDIYVASDPSRVMLEASQYKNLIKPLALPAASLGEEISDELNGIEIKDYGLNLSPGDVHVSSHDCSLPNRLAVSYALALAVIGECRSVSLIGLDGYDADDPRQQEMIRTLELFAETYPSLNMQSLTPTKYPVRQGSIYAPKFI